MYGPMNVSVVAVVVKGATKKNRKKDETLRNWWRYVLNTDLEVGRRMVTRYYIKNSGESAVPLLLVCDLLVLSESDVR